jgi:hypothetical protein
MRDRLLQSAHGILGVVWASVTLTACVTAQQSPLRTADDSPDSSAFALVLRTVQVDTSRTWWLRPLHVDPRPLRNDRDVVDVYPSQLAPATSAELHTRERTIRALGMVPEEANLPKGCAGTMVPVIEAHRGCPQDVRLIAVVGRPRRGDVMAPAGAAPDTSRWTARVLAWMVSPSGFNVQSYDYVIEQRDGRWRFVAMRPIGWVE